MKSSARTLQLLPGALLTAIFVLLLTGCGSNNVAPAPPAPPAGSYPGVTFTGTAKSGAQPIIGAAVQLYAAGTTGSGSTPTALLTAALTSDSAGSFTVPAAYPCPAATSQIYLVARGGHVGTASANSNIALITTLGLCNQVAASAHYTVNEVTTVATVWALAQFLTAGGNLGASATNSTGLGNAVATAANLANPLTGVAPGATFPSNSTAPTARINSFANLLNTCTSATSSTTACSTLVGSSQNTLDAALRIVRNPSANAAALYTQSIASIAFSPVLTAPPADWTLFLNFTGSDMYYPNTLAVDGSGNVWVASYFSASHYPGQPAVASVAKFSPVGVSLFPNGITGNGLSTIYGLAVDSQNNVWIANQLSPSSVNKGQGSITVLNSSGQLVSPATGYTAGNLDYPSAVGMDPDGSVWIVNNGNSTVAHLSSTGSALSGASGYGAPTIAFPISLVVDANHNAWVGNQNDGIVNRVTNTGTVTPFHCCASPDGIAIDGAGNIWPANYGAASVSQISSTGTIVSTGYAGNGNFNGPQAIAADGAGNIWVGSFHGPVLTELAGASSTTPAPGQPLSPTAGWAPDASLSGAYGLAIDSSGNIWISNLFSNSLEEFVGLAAPIKTPLIGPPQTP